jgi:hypothetical protein
MKLLRRNLIIRLEIIIMKTFTGIFICQCTPIGPFIPLVGIIQRLVLLMGRETEVGASAYAVLSMNLLMPKDRVAPVANVAEVHLLAPIVQGTVVQVDAIVEGVAQEEDVVDVLVRNFIISCIAKFIY